MSTTDYGPGAPTLQELRLQELRAAIEVRAERARLHAIRDTYAQAVVKVIAPPTVMAGEPYVEAKKRWAEEVFELADALMAARGAP